MPGRTVPLVTGQYYHVFNKGIDGRVTFSKKRECERALLCLWYYKHVSAPVKLSTYLTQSVDYRSKIAEEFSGSETWVDVLAYCLMDNHFHILVKQNQDGGISKYMSQFQNSYTRYFNSRNKRKGPLFFPNFRAVRIGTDEQLVHVSRYIHLNPHSGYLVEDLDEVWEYPWSSMKEYLGVGVGLDLCSVGEILTHFDGVGEYREFVADQAGYQRDLKKIRHLSPEVS